MYIKILVHKIYVPIFSLITKKLYDTLTYLVYNYLIVPISLYHYYIHICIIKFMLVFYQTYIRNLLCRMNKIINLIQESKKNKMSEIELI